MTRDELERAIRAACEVGKTDQLIIFPMRPLHCASLSKLTLCRLATQVRRTELTAHLVNSQCFTAHMVFTFTA